GRLVGRRHEFERRIGERKHLLKSIELVEQRKPGVDIPKRLEPGKQADHGMIRDERAQTLEIRLGREMVEDVDHRRAVGSQMRSLPYCAMALAAKSSSSFISRGVSPCSSEYCATVSSTRRLASMP